MNLCFSASIGNVTTVKQYFDDIRPHLSNHQLSKEEQRNILLILGEACYQNQANIMDYIIDQLSTTQIIQMIEQSDHSQQYPDIETRYPFRTRLLGSDQLIKMAQTTSLQDMETLHQLHAFDGFLAIQAYMDIMSEYHPPKEFSTPQKTIRDLAITRMAHLTDALDKNFLVHHCRAIMDIVAKTNDVEMRTQLMNALDEPRLKKVQIATWSHSAETWLSGNHLQAEALISLWPDDPKSPEILKMIQEMLDIAPPNVVHFLKAFRPQCASYYSTLIQHFDPSTGSIEPLISYIHTHQAGTEALERIAKKGNGAMFQALDRWLETHYIGQRDTVRQTLHNMTLMQATEQTYPAVVEAILSTRQPTIYIEDALRTAILQSKTEEEYQITKRLLNTERSQHAIDDELLTAIRLTEHQTTPEHQVEIVKTLCNTIPPPSRKTIDQAFHQITERAQNIKDPN